MPELTVVVPTKNRQGTAMRTVAQAASLGAAAEVEVVVHDCSDAPSLRGLLADAGLADRVAYFHTTDAISMTENWNRAMARARGEYVMVIGDDDAVAHDLLATTRAARAAGLEAVKARRVSTFWHPDFGAPERAATLSLPPFTGAAEVLDARTVLRAACTTGDRYFDLPMVYHGLVAASVMRRVRERTGAYFHGVAPDIYSAFAVGCVIERFGVVDYPISIVGASGRSNTARATRGLLGLHFREYAGHAFTWLAPDSFALVASNTDNVVRALEGLGREDLLHAVEVPRVYARTIVAEPLRAPAHVRKFARVSRRLGRSLAVELPRLAAMVGAKAVIDVARRFRAPAPASTNILYSDVPDVAAACELQRRWLAEHGVALAALR